MILYRTRQKGVGLLELMLAFAIGILIAIAGFNQYHNYAYRKNVTITRQSVEYVMQGLNNYWVQTCATDDITGDSNYTKVTLNDMASAGALPVAEGTIQNPFAVGDTGSSDGPFYGIIAMTQETTPSVAGTVGKTYYKTKFWVVGYFPNVNSSNEEFFRGLFGAQKVQGNQLLWSSYPGLDMPKLNTDLWPLNATQRYHNNLQYNKGFNQAIKKVAKSAGASSTDVLGECIRRNLPTSQSEISNLTDLIKEERVEQSGALNNGSNNND